MPPVDRRTLLLELSRSNTAENLRTQLGPEGRRVELDRGRYSAVTIRTDFAAVEVHGPIERTRTGSVAETRSGGRDHSRYFAAHSYASLEARTRPAEFDTDGDGVNEGSQYTPYTSVVDAAPVHSVRTRASGVEHSTTRTDETSSQMTLLRVEARHTLQYEHRSGTTDDTVREFAEPMTLEGDDTALADLLADRRPVRPDPGRTRLPAIEEEPEEPGTPPGDTGSDRSGSGTGTDLYSPPTPPPAPRTQAPPPVPGDAADRIEPARSDDLPTLWVPELSSRVQDELRQAMTRLVPGLEMPRGAAFDRGVAELRARLLADPEQAAALPELPTEEIGRLEADRHAGFLVHQLLQDNGRTPGRPGLRGGAPGPLDTHTGGGPATTETSAPRAGTPETADGTRPSSPDVPEIVVTPPQEPDGVVTPPPVPEIVVWSPEVGDVIPEQNLRRTDPPADLAVGTDADVAAEAFEARTRASHTTSMDDRTEIVEDPTIPEPEVSVPQDLLPSRTGPAGLTARDSLVEDAEVADRLLRELGGETPEPAPRPESVGRSVESGHGGERPSGAGPGGLPAGHRRTRLRGIGRRRQRG
ncbi:hypothetical protein [Pseudonocardia sp. ICBG1293]|uniref:hypothetical protein n=1 Tax=Pseudonocardia sp. ICBG1293 TaxID=2844382 RepID=UPI001CCD99A3|nr:hypothetical protein [Pseudonocardia sp. ICBG1293]